MTTQVPTEETLSIQTLGAKGAQFSLTPDDSRALQEFGASVIPQIKEIIDKFYAWAEKTPAIWMHLDGVNLAGIKQQQCEAWRLFMTDPFGEATAAMLKQIGRTHAALGIRPFEYSAGVNHFRTLFGEKFDDEAAELLTRFLGMKTALVIDEFMEASDEILSAQSKAILELATPVADLWEGILMLPVVGVIDSSRAEQIMGTVLARIAEGRTRVLILDISGVAVVDTAVAAHLVRFTKASMLMGCHSVVSGLSPEIAQTIVDLGVDVTELNTSGSLMDALDQGLALTGRKIISTGREA